MSEELYLIVSWLLVTLAAERTTEIISDSKFFLPLRNWFASRALAETPKTPMKLLCMFLFEVVSCAWCLSVWVSMLFAWFLPGDYFDVYAPDNILVKWLALVGMANLWHAIFRLIHRGRVLTVDIKHTIDGNTDELEELGIQLGENSGESAESDVAPEDSQA